MVFKPQRLVCMYQQSECRNKGKEIPEAWIHQHLELAKSGVSRTRNWKAVAKAFRRNRMGSEEYVFKKWATVSQPVEELRIIKAENFSFKNRKKRSQLTLGTFIQHSIGCPRHSNQTNKEIKGIQIGKENGQYLQMAWYYVEKPKTPPKKY